MIGLIILAVTVGVVIFAFYVLALEIGAHWGSIDHRVGKKNWKNHE